MVNIVYYINLINSIDLNILSSQINCFDLIKCFDLALIWPRIIYKIYTVYLISCFQLLEW